METTMASDPTCDLPGQGLKNPGRAFPDPEADVARAEDRGEAILAGGCFWCTEAVFRGLAGVVAVEPGYAGGAADTANYKDVCSGATGHAEVIRISYDPDRISYGQLLKVFFAVAHDPTQKDRQGNDVGTQYRSAVFPLDDVQQAVARAYIAQLQASGVFAAPLATTIEPLEAFFVAEAYHHDYAAKNPGQPYIRMVSQPKVEKLRHTFPDRLRSGR
jgi:peptide-methionine (S)-S-oxide reductase